MKFVKLVLTNIVILVILLVILEFVLRAMGLGYGSAPSVNDDILHHVHPKNYELVMHTPSKEYGGHTIFFDGFGNRVRSIGEKHRSGKVMWLMGDSFAEGMQLIWDSTYAGILENDLHEYQIINFGMSSYAPVLYYLQLKQALKIHPKPNIVIIQLYSNDVRDDDEYLKSGKFDERGELIAVDGGKPDKKLELLRKSYLVRYLRMLQLKWQYMHKNSNEKQAGITVDGLLEETLPISGSSTEIYVKKIDTLLRSHDINYFFFAIPSKYINLTKDKNFESFSSKANRFFEGNNIPYLNIDSSFNAADSVFYMTDIHLNAKGNRILTNEIKKYLHENRN